MHLHKDNHLPEKDGLILALDESVKLTQKCRETYLQKYKSLLSR
ncbi:MAG TPA: hypothetical protein PK304_03205 [Mobilitalea sp.]|nr:hypothetical protein [Mobilitalea sp.]